MTDKYDAVEIKCTLEGESAKAWRVAIDGTEYWVGKSIGVFEYHSKEGTLIVPKWWMNSKNKAVAQQRNDYGDDEPVYEEGEP